MSEPVEWLPFPPKRPRGSRPPGWAPEAEAIITQVREEVEDVRAIAESGGGGGAPLTPDPVNDGFYVIPSGSTLTPDPDNSGFYKIGA